MQTAREWSNVIKRGYKLGSEVMLLGVSVKQATKLSLFPDGSCKGGGGKAGLEQDDVESPEAGAKEQKGLYSKMFCIPKPDGR